MRERILAEAVSLFVEHGYAAVSMREIAAACGITKAALYYHFAGKSDLLYAIFVAYLDDLATIVSDSAGHGSGETRLRWLVTALFEVAPQRRAVMRLALHDVAQLEPEHRDEFGHAYRERFIAPLQELLREGVRAGEFRPIDPEVGVWLLLGMLYPFFTPPGRPPARGTDAVAELLDVFCHGVVAPRPGPPGAERG